MLRLLTCGIGNHLHASSVVVDSPKRMVYGCCCDLVLLQLNSFLNGPLIVLAGAAESGESR